MNFTTRIKKIIYKLRYNTFMAPHAVKEILSDWHILIQRARRVKVIKAYERASKQRFICRLFFIHVIKVMRRHAFLKSN